MPKPRSQRSPSEASDRLERAKWLFAVVWSIIGIVALLVAVGYVLGSVLPAIAIVLIAALVIFILRTPVAWLARHRVPRWAGTLIAYAGMFLIIGVLILVFIPVIWKQLMGLLSLIPGYINQAGVWWQQFYAQYQYLLEDSNVQQIVSSLGGTLSSWAVNMMRESASQFITIGTGMVAALIGTFVALVVGFWVLKDLPRIGHELRVIIGPRFEEDVLFISSTFARSVGGYLRGILVQGTCSGLISGISFSLIGLPYPAILGLFVGLMNFIPIVGPWVAAATCGLFGLFVSPLAALLAIMTILVAQQLVDNFVTPRVMSAVVELHPAIVLVGIFTGGALGGVLGLVAAIPLLATAKSVFVYYFERHTGRRLVSENGALFRSNRERGKKAKGENADAKGADTGTGVDAEDTFDPVADATGAVLTEKDLLDEGDGRE
ncbi:MAG: AI-2E family transporter [Coriobacteriales bacterium]|jgi:predicted PurR-regulated permease PerM|nr:AI-2E family transporter [Coriobacteriales bacterium]